MTGVADIVTTRTGRTHIVAAALAIGIPALVAISVPHDIHRTNIPSGLMLLGVLGASAVGGLAWGLIAATSALVVLGVFFLGPSGAVSLSSGNDRAAAAVYAVVAFGLAIVIDLLMRRLRTVERAQATLSAELVAERRVLSAMQVALLPKEIVRPDGVDLCVRYRPADELARIGGDWYAIVPLPDRTVGLGIGDVAGSGLAAVALMAEVRYALRTLAFGGTGPHEVLRLLNEQVCEFEQDAMVTALYGVLDPHHNTWRQAVAGHPPALVRAGAHATFLTGASGPPLGLENTARYEQDQTQLPAGATLLLYTDGLIERRNENLTQSFDRLRATALRTTDDLPTMCERLLDELLGDAAHDDVALLAARSDPTKIRSTRT